MYLPILVFQQGFPIFFQRDSKSATEFFTPGIWEKMKSMLNIAAINHRFLAHVASVGSLALPVFSTSTTAILSQKICTLFLVQ